MDFVLEGDEESLHILNAVSPGFTCAFPMADYVCQRIQKTAHIWKINWSNNFKKHTNFTVLIEDQNWFWHFDQKLAWFTLFNQIVVELKIIKKCLLVRS